MQGVRLGLMAACLAWPPAAPAEARALVPGGDSQLEHPAKTAAFGGEPASDEARQVADWVIDSSDNRGLPFLVVDKVNAKVFGFDAGGLLLGAAPALLGLAKGDDSPPGIGGRTLSSISAAERITPAGRFVAGLGENLGGQDILWIDYDAAVSLHRVVAGKKSERRLHRLTTASTLDNRVSYGCINVPVLFFDTVVLPMFTAKPGIVYILPDAKALKDVFPDLDKGARPGS